MCRYRRSLQAVAVALGLIAGGSPGTLKAQGRQADVPNESLALVERLVKAAYPDLIARGSGVEVTLKPHFDRSWNGDGIIGVTITPSKQQQTAAGSDGPFLTLFIHVMDGRIFTSAAHGSYVNDDAQAGLRQTIGARLNWTPDDIQRTVRAAGGRFGPADREAFLAQTDVAAIANAMGRVLNLKVEFAYPDADPGIGTVAFYWAATLRIRDSSDREICYGLRFEPFGGRLTGLGGGLCESP
jgi:hypothetical protein